MLTFRQYAEAHRITYPGIDIPHERAEARWQELLLKAKQQSLTPEERAEYLALAQQRQPQPTTPVPHQYVQLPGEEQKARFAHLRAVSRQEKSSGLKLMSRDERAEYVRLLQQKAAEDEEFDAARDPSHPKWQS